MLCQRPAEAYPAFRRAVALAGDDPALLFNLAAVARFLGHAEEAARAYDRRHRPVADLVDGLSQSFGAAPPVEFRRPRLANFRRRLADHPPWQGEVQLAYALGKELEDLKDYEAAFQAYARGAGVRRQHMRYSVEDDVDTLKAIADTFDAAYCAPARDAVGAPGPIFILGMPRTGSTLLERQPAGHPDVEALGELQTFGQTVVEGVRRHATAPITGKGALIEASAKVPPEALGRAYLEAVAPLRERAGRLSPTSCR